MPTLNFNIDINAPKAKVWDALWTDANYRQWTAPFMEGSYAEGDWQEGSKMLFLSPGGNGMSSIIQKKDEPNAMVFRHVGEVKNNIEHLKDWKDALESYHLQDNNEGTQLMVELQMDDDNAAGFADYFNNTFPKALALVKELAER